jgi:uncharacterized protein (TIGR02996 family)
MEQHATFLLALSPNPQGDVTRLVYADWLEEQGHPLAELLRLQVEIARRRAGDAEVPALHAREKAILREQGEPFGRLGEELGGRPEAQKKFVEDVLGLSTRDPVALTCPVCGGTLVRGESSSRSVALLWKLVPAFAFNELALGQRVLRDGLVCRGCLYACARCTACRRFPEQDRFYRAFGHWAGPRCPDCGAAIPTADNLVTGAVHGAGKAAAWGLSRLLGRRSQP